MIYYLGYYSCEQISEEKRKAPPPAINKMGYMISVLSEIAKEDVLVVSPSETLSNQYVKGQVTKLNERTSIRTFASFYSKCRPIRVLGHFLTRTQLALFLLKQIKKDDTLIVYHSLALMGIVKRVKKLKKCKLIIEAEELYTDVFENTSLRKKEIAFLQIADSYIAVTKSLDRIINFKNKPSIVSHGTYKTVPPRGEKISDGKTHVVYAGSFCAVKSGAMSAVEAAEFLDGNYVMHILGRGKPDETEAIIQRIKEVSGKTKCELIYHGYKTGEEFEALVQSCHIGLSTRQAGEKYNESSFPSKVLMYMSNDLPVVSVKVPAIQESNVGEYIYYYDSVTPQDIAQAIKSVPVNQSFDVRQKLNQLDETFKEELSGLLN